MATEPQDADNMEERMQQAEIRWQEEIRRADDSRYDKLETRVRNLEAKGRLFESMSDERLYLIVFAVYVFFAFVLPALRGSNATEGT